VEIREIAIFDALEHRIEPRASRGELVDGTRETALRYQHAGKLSDSCALSRRRNVPLEFAIRAMANPVAAVIAIGVAIPILVAVRLAENEQVNREIQRRRTALPVALPAGSETSVHLFFPIAPLPGRTQVVYADRHGEHRLEIDTRQALAAQPPPPALVSRVDPEFPVHADRKGIRQGSVKARLGLDRQGAVRSVELIESVPSHVFDREARRTLRMWTYNRDTCDDRTVEATLEFKH
jgi:TonB family protein